MKKMSKALSYLVPTIALTMTFTACTDLAVKELDSKIIESASGQFTGVTPTTALKTSYNDLNQFGDQNNMYAMLEVASDELLVPTRGTDWGDNGVWRLLHTHDWDATHPAILTAWNNLNANGFRLNQLLAPESKATAEQAAEGKFLRAWNAFYVLDFWRQIPQRGVNDEASKAPEVLTGQAAFDFIVGDLESALPNLPKLTAGAAVNAGVRASQAAARFLLAKMYLNKHIYLKSTPQAADMNKVIGYVDAIDADGFALQAGYFEIFTKAPDSETIFWINAGVGNRIWNGMHYKMFSDKKDEGKDGGWNGFSTTADFYALFEGSAANNNPGSQEERRGFVPNTPTSNGTGIGFGFLVGQQYGKDGVALKDRAGAPLVFTKDFPGLAGNNERTGIRVIKYHPGNGNEFAEHQILFRYADAHLMKIEAILRGGTSADAAQTLFDEIRTLRGASNKAVSLDELFKERGRELYIEGWRRNDQVRFGKYATPYGFKTNTDAYRDVYPIPQSAIASNPNLKQNEGY
jgi:starch-binding outer membrane protein, SusD/RagB family